MKYVKSFKDFLLENDMTSSEEGLITEKDDTPVDVRIFIKKTKGYETTDSDVAKWLKGKGDKPTGDPS